MKPFIESKTCTGRQHCKNCRAKDAGRIFRENLKAIYALPGNAVDFDCPFDVPWEFTGDAKALAPTAAPSPPRQVQVNVKPTPFGPGSVVEIVLKKMGYKKTSGCGCAAFAKKMNQYGWRACLFKHRAEIVEWFTAKAKEQGIAIDGAGVRIFSGSSFAVSADRVRMPEVYTSNDGKRFHFRGY